MARRFARIILNQLDQWNSFSFSSFSCFVRLAKEWLDQNAKKRMSVRRGREREKAVHNDSVEEEGRVRHHRTRTEQFTDIVQTPQP